ncbi:cell division protein ZapA [Legionella taurinensis]|uniref:Cell division protein ZapA n=1 Tax=Legionella taurinensis TaxID=70611 RepID=A0A3A5LI85_9GAMM|nr:cell division protein ZapA [Legionella taurinensis]MDX1836181.1 cell division protein ZapA [Legionella taurinensis]PUT42052.1 cell division protein ZapA [Legionella taurinensis]PUT44839.1 cell division protein ZapA [Legionella taurinensis]PUT48160.1 cell division protein ZapA [Legionella taurinensis]PUT48974.1 cell division protein ZapA [Legionella taurinensis]
MSTSKTCSIRLLSKTYDIKCPEHETDNLQLAAQKLQDQLLANKRKFKQLDDFNNLLLAALHISHELINYQRLQEQQRHQVTQFISSLENKINQVVNGSPELQPD